MPHREERQFTITLHLSAEFPEDYEGDDDGYTWHDDFERRVRGRVIAAVIDALRSEPSWQVVPAPRGRPPSEAIDIDVRRLPVPS
jgi:hypothetical protein